MPVINFIFKVHHKSVVHADEHTMKEKTREEASFPIVVHESVYSFNWHCRDVYADKYTRKISKTKEEANIPIVAHEFVYNFN